MKTIAVYGSLMSNRYNHGMISGSNLLGKSTIKATMYSMGSYPAIIDGDDEHIIELYEVDDDVHMNVLNMELGAGYVEREQEFIVEGGQKYTAKVYYAGERLESYCKQVKEIIKSY